MSTETDATEETVQAKKFEKVWEKDGTDVVRFVLRRAEWRLLIKAIATATVWAPRDERGTMWDALDVLRSAEEDIDASALIKALTKIASYTERLRDNDSIIVHMVASDALASVEVERKEG